VASRLGTVLAANDEELEVDSSLETSPSVLFDAVVLPDGEEAVHALLRDGHSTEFVKDQYRHCKTILAMGASQTLLAAAGIKSTLLSGKVDPGILLVDAADASTAAAEFIEAMTAHRHTVRDSDPPLI
jgi:catalase